MMDNAIHVYKDESLSKEGAFKLKDSIKNNVFVENIADAAGASNQGN